MQTSTISYRVFEIFITLKLRRMVVKCSKEKPPFCVGVLLNTHMHTSRHTHIHIWIIRWLIPLELLIRKVIAVPCQMATHSTVTNSGAACVCVLCLWWLCSRPGLQLLSKSDCVTSYHTADSTHKHSRHPACVSKFPCHWIGVVSHLVFKSC